MYDVGMNVCMAFLRFLDMYIDGASTLVIILCKEFFTLSYHRVLSAETGISGRMFVSHSLHLCDR